MTSMPCETKKAVPVVAAGSDGFDRAGLPIKEPITEIFDEIDVRIVLQTGFNLV